MKVELTKSNIRHTVEFDGLKFVMRPQSIADRVTAMRIIKEAELYEADLAQLILVDVIVVLCIDSWEGVVMDGEPAECTLDNKLALAAQFPLVAQKLTQEYNKVLVSAEGNSESSPAGSPTSNGRESAKTASG